MSNVWYQANKERWKGYYLTQKAKGIIFPSHTPERSRERLRLARENRSNWVREYKNKLACIKCGFKSPRALDFHHRDPSAKRAKISKLVGKAMSLTAIIAEIAKCDVLCGNCHRLMHASELQIARTNKRTPHAEKLYQEKLSLVRNKKVAGCKMCGFSNSAAIDFHHRNPLEKEILVSKLVHAPHNIKKLVAEIEKCDLLCVNCHRIHHENEFANRA